MRIGGSKSGVRFETANRSTLARKCIVLPEGFLVMGKRGYLAAGVQLAAGSGGRLAGPPKHLNSEAAAFWRRTAKILKSQGRLTAADAAAFERLCIAWAALGHIDAILSREGWTVATAAGGVKPHPAAALRQAESKTLIALLDRFGLNPAARLRVPAEPEDRPDSLEAKYFSPQASAGKQFSEGNSDDE
jgi:P27 family predicted phage terminase small subunit